MATELIVQTSLLFKLSFVRWSYYFLLLQIPDFLSLFLAWLLTIDTSFINHLTLSKFFVMHAIVEKGNKNYKRDKKDQELTLIELYKPVFKVVVNNYSRQKRETMVARQFGLPSQPTRYLKYPEYDWLWLKFLNDRFIDQPQIK